MSKYGLLIACFWITFGYAQPQRMDREALYKIANEKIYVDPDYSLKIWNQLLKGESKKEKLANIYCHISRTYLAKRDFDASFQYALKAQDLIKDISDVKVKMNILISLAVQYQQMELFSNSFELLSEIETLAHDLPDTVKVKSMNLGNVYAIRGMIYKSQSNPELALTKFDQAIQYFKKYPNELSPQANLSVVYYNKGYCFLNLKNIKLAKENFLKSIEYAKNVKAKSLEAFAYKGLADVLFTDKNYNEALQLLNQAETLSATVGDLVLNEGIYKGKADCFLALDLMDQYHIYNKKFIKTKFEREQSELKSINRSIDNQIEINSKNNQAIQQKHRIKIGRAHV